MDRDESADKQIEKLSAGWIVAGVVLLASLLIGGFVAWPRPTAFDLAKADRLVGMRRGDLVTWQRKPDSTPVLDGWDMTFSYPNYLGFFDNVVCIQFDGEGRVAHFEVTEL